MNEIIQALKEYQDRQPQPFDTTAEVIRVEGDTAWVQMPGSDDETPVRMTINATEGETVQVRVSGGDAFLVGNESAPPTDDKQAFVAQAKAEEVQADLNEQKEYFWHDDDGAHIQGNLSGYRNDLKSDGMHIVESQTGEEIATFSTDIVEIGKSSTNSVIKFCNSFFNITGSKNPDADIGIGYFSVGDTYDSNILPTHNTGLDFFVVNNRGSLPSSYPLTKSTLIRMSASAYNSVSALYIRADQAVFDVQQFQINTNNFYVGGTTTTWEAITPFDATKIDGGYYEEGKHVYVSISCNLNSAASSGDNVTLFSGLTAPLFMVPLEVMVANTRNGVAWINDSGELHFRPTASVSTSNTVIINGHYTSA